MASVLTAPFLCTELLFAFLEGWEVSHNHVTDSQGWLAPGKQAELIPPTAPHLHSPHQGTCSKWSHLSHQTSLTRTKCSLLSLVEASSGYKAAFSGLRILRQNREQCPFHLPWLTFLLSYRNEGPESSEGWQGLYIILWWTVSLSLCLLALHWLLITFLRHQFTPLEQELSTRDFHSAWDIS